VPAGRPDGVRVDVDECHGSASVAAVRRGTATLTAGEPVDDDLLGFGHRLPGRVSPPPAGRAHLVCSPITAPREEWRVHFPGIDHHVVTPSGTVRRRDTVSAAPVSGAPRRAASSARIPPWCPTARTKMRTCGSSGSGSSTATAAVDVRWVVVAGVRDRLGALEPFSP